MESDVPDQGSNEQFTVFYLDKEGQNYKEKSKKVMRFSVKDFPLLVTRFIYNLCFFFFRTIVLIQSMIEFL
jgi:hypothetical protein